MSDSEVLAEETTAVNGAKRGRGRPKKGATPAKQVRATDNGVTDQTNGTNGEKEVSETKRRGRKPAAAPPVKPQKSTAPAAGAKRGRGRPKKGTGATGAKRGRKPGKKTSSSESVEEEAAPIDDPIDDDEEREEHEEEEDEED